VNRRESVILLGSAAAAWPLAARAQQPTIPVIGFLTTTSPDWRFGERLRKFSQGLKEQGFVEGENVAILYRFADDQADRLPELMADLVRRKVAVIVTAGPPATFAAQAATATIPITFLVAEDPVRLGLAASLSRPGSNMTGINVFNAEVAAKRLELLRDLVPGVTRIAVFVNSADAASMETQLRDVDTAARAMGLRIQTLDANTSAEIDAGFKAFGRERPDAVFIPPRLFFNNRRVQLTQLATFHHLPAMYGLRDYAEVGGLMSYGSNLGDGYRQVGVYVGRILKGAKPADFANRASEQVRTGNQHADRAHARYRRADVAARDCRRADGVRGCLAASAHGSFWYITGGRPPRAGQRPFGF
jgi:putative tryptophan/tyrosine transport system substrate-binding protein